MTILQLAMARAAAHIVLTTDDPGESTAAAMLIRELERKEQEADSAKGKR